MPHSEQEFTFDARRKALLDAYTRCWGKPDHHVRVTNRYDGGVLEVYAFRAGGPRASAVSRFATVGVSAHRSGASPLDLELLLVVPPDLGGATEDAVLHFMLDVAAHELHTCTTHEVPSLVPETALAPSPWKPRALLIDEARGEPEELSAISLGRATIVVHWVIPIYASEHAFISASGIELFDHMVEQHAVLSLVDINREPVVLPTTPTRLGARSTVIVMSSSFMTMSNAAERKESEPPSPSPPAAKRPAAPSFAGAKLRARRSPWRPTESARATRAGDCRS